MTELNGKVALVTGAAAKRSMGRTIAVQLAKDGADVIVADKFADAEEHLGRGRGLERPRRGGGRDRGAGQEGSGRHRPTSALAPMSTPWLPKRSTSSARSISSSHCVGVRGPVPIPVVDLDESTWRMLLDINLTGAFLVAKAVAKTMIPDGEGKKIVLVSSMAGVGPYPGGAGYAASKHGLLGLMKSMSRELAPYKINVNAINPGGFDTNFRDESVTKQAKERGHDCR